MSPYRTPEPRPAPAPKKIGVDFWNEENSYLESRAIQFTDSAIVSGLGKLVDAWYKETRTRYPKDYHPMLHDLAQATLGKGTFLRVSGESRALLSILIEIARMKELLTVKTKLFDQAIAEGATMTSQEKESAVRWVASEREIRGVLNSAFTSGGNRLDKVLLSRFEPEEASNVMRVVYFRGVVQGDTASYDSFRLAQILYHALYE